MEFVEFNSSVTLSEQYAILGKVAQEVGQIYKKSYQKSGDETLKQLAQGYYTMKQEAKYLSKLVKHHLQEHDKEILICSAILTDGASDCVYCVVKILTSYLALPQCAVCLACAAPCATIFTIWWCIGCILVPCSMCIIYLSTFVYNCYKCAEYQGWI